MTTTRESNFTKQQQLEALAKHDAGTSVAHLCCELQISAATFYKWKKDKAVDEDDTQCLGKCLVVKTVLAKHELHSARSKVTRICLS